MADQAKPSVLKEVNRRKDSGQCLQCEEKAEEGKRGLCGKHYWRWYRSVCSLDDTAREDKTSKLVRDGKILKSRQGQRLQEAS